MSKKRPDDFSLPYGDQGQSDEDHSYLAQSPTLVPDASNWTGSGNADARGAGGGPGGGGKPGGGGSGVVTTYTSGNPNVDDASEFNIQINFSGRWTADEQAIVKWAADFYSQIITADIHDDFDLNNNLVDDIVITISTGRIDGNGSPLTGNILAQTSNIIVRDAGTWRVSAAMPPRVQGARLSVLSSTKARPSPSGPAKVRRFWPKLSSRCIS